ncbi:I78 family peptidase inhibitor [Sphingomonas sp. TX0543]|uniref:I78 family peptidase inhibitor n=1 Tax=unclassified Sphingomonas TaxID=196159 RepID=UPI0010F555A7|nr:I78 family peptidase inhibitor [Sphingomonas sp. 3P27F8]
MTKALFAALPLIALAGCVDDRPGMPGPVRECRAGPAQRFVGAPFRPALVRQAQRAAGARSVRVLYPGQAATMDFRADRLNINVGERNIIRSLNCG